MEPLTRPLQSHAFRALLSNPTTANATLRTLATQHARNWPSCISSSSSYVRHATTTSKFTIPCVEKYNSRSFSTTLPLSKKKKHKSDNDSNAAASPSAEDPFDFSSLEETIKNAVEKFRAEVSKLRAGGRLNPEVLESLRVTVNKSTKETARLGDLAQVIPKGGRMVTILVGEEDYIKPISSAISSSHLSLNAQLDPHNPLQLNIPIPPPTKESRDAAVKDAKTAMERAANAVRLGRSEVNKKLQNMGKQKAAPPDDLRKAKEMMEKIAQRGQKEIQDLFAGAKKVLGGD
ncbi:hypothetical protein VTO42DRAFT_6593 [Malbranchea cinnamomea]